MYRGRVLYLFIGGVLLASATCLLGQIPATERPDDDEKDNFSRAEEPKLTLRYRTEGKRLADLGHWSFAMKPNSFVIREGVVFQRGAVDRPLIVGGTKEQPPAQLAAKLDTLDELDLADRATTQAAFLDWQARYFGRELPEERREQLARLYRLQAEKQDKLLHGQKLDSLSKQEQLKLNTEIAKSTVDFLLAEKALFDGNPVAQERRYGKRLPQKKLSTASRQRLERELVRFFTAQYIAADMKKASAARLPERAPDKHRSILTKRLGSNR